MAMRSTKRAPVQHSRNVTRSMGKPEHEAHVDDAAAELRGGRIARPPLPASRGSRANGKR